MTNSVEITTSLENTNNVEIVSKNLPDITIVFAGNEEYKLQYLLSMEHIIHNNFTFKNTYNFTTALMPLGLLNELEKGGQISKIIINEVMKNSIGEDFSRNLIIYLPEVIVSRNIDTTGDNVLWTFKISYKTL